MVIEDNEDILFNLKLLLEGHKYEVVTAINGIEALKQLSELEKPPNLIISDIMMPKMNGIELFQEISSNQKWGEIPFIFLTARTSPKDIRLGKMLGVDDYLTKPILEEDLIASITGKLARSNKIRSINQKTIELFEKFDIGLDPSISLEEESHVSLFLMFWDDVYGPKLKKYYSNDKDLPYSIKNAGVQLFSAAVLIYGQENMIKAEGILLNIEYIKMHGYVYFDSYPDDTQRSGQKQYMIGTIAPKINYFDSLQIKALFQEISSKINANEEWDIEESTEKVFNVLSSKVL